MTETANNTCKLASITKPWMKYYPEELKDIELPQCTMYEQIRRSCDKNKRIDAPALFYYGTEITYGEMFRRIEQYAAAFASLGIQKGEMVTIVSAPLPETMCELYALNKIGAVCNFIDPRTDGPHTREFTKKAKSRVVLTLEMCWKHFEGHLEELGLDYVICQNPYASLPFIKRLVMTIKNEKYKVPYDGQKILTDKQLFARGEGKTVPDVAYEPDMPAVITRTGGTTGVSKGVVLTNDNMNCLAANFFVTISVTVPNQSFLNFLPIASSYGICIGVHVAMTMGVKDILIPRFDPEKFDDLILEFKPKHMISVPVFYEKLMYSEKLKGVDLSFIDTMTAGGDSASESFEDKLDEFRLEHNIHFPIAQGYGMSEVSSSAAFGFRELHRKGSVGVPAYFVTVSIFEPGTTNELPIGEVGEICISGPTVMKEYLDEPEETANILHKHPDGKIWVHSGDLGRMDEDGFLYIVGRIKRSIIRFDAHKVYPLQIENVVMNHPKVSNCAVIAIKDREHVQGELPLVIAEIGVRDFDKKAVAAEIMQLCSEQLEGRGQPIGVTFIDRIPTTDMAKNDVRKLAEQYKDFDYRTML